MAFIFDGHRLHWRGYYAFRETENVHAHFTKLPTRTQILGQLKRSNRNCARSSTLLFGH